MNDSSFYNNLNTLIINNVIIIGSMVPLRISKNCFTLHRDSTTKDENRNTVS